jgi:hypothetical protein
MAKSKVVIKINYDKDKEIKARIQPKMITVWHFRRIAAAVTLLLAIVLIAFSLFSGRDTGIVENLDLPVHTENKAPSDIATKPDASSQAFSNDLAAKDVKEGNKQGERIKSEAKGPAAIIFDKKVIRASLNTALKDNEPYEQVKQPLGIGINQAVDLFYFNELRDIKDRVLYHNWSKDGKTVYKKKLDIKTSRTKVVSSKTLSNKDKGEWQIQLVDKRGKVFSEVKFYVYSE